MPATVERDEIPATGIEIQCNHCGFSFLVRSHSPEHGEQEDTTVPEGKEDFRDLLAQESPGTTRVGPESGFLQGLPFEVLLARDEVPYAIVKAHQACEERRAAARFAGSLGRASATQDIPIHEDGAIRRPSDRQALKTEPVPEASPFLLEPRGSAMKKKMRPLTGRVLRWVALILTVGLLAGALLYFRPFSKIPWDVLRTWYTRIRTYLPVGTQETGSIQFSDLNSYFVPGGKGQNSAFVIEGNATNHYGTACKFIQVKGTLFDAKGDRAAEQTAYCGNILKRQEIQNSTPDRIQEILQRPSGAALSNLSIEPGKSIPFMLVFPNPPENVSEFSVEILGYQKEDLPEQSGDVSGPARMPPASSDSREP